jgi:hypothetical protein
MVGILLLTGQPGEDYQELLDEYIKLIGEK